MQKQKQLELYIHIPFCVRKCAYCDFLSGPANRDIQRRYVDALLSEIESFSLHHRSEIQADVGISTVFFGGGTPSILPAEWILEILDRIHSCFAVLPEAEITIECNPGTADENKLAAYRSAGINRISFGLQSADNRELKLLGRIHTWEEFLDTYHAARRAGFQNINVDLMSALPGQTAVSWEDTLHKVIALHPEHISAYSLIIEEGTPFYDQYHEDDEIRARGEIPLVLPSEEAERLMYEKTEQQLAKSGYHRYEISNYALKDRECRHNIGYWTGVEYLGFGLGASSLWNHARYKNTEEMELYLHSNESIERHRECERLTMEDEMEEFMFLGLRMIDGVSEEEFRHKFRRSIEEIYAVPIEKMEKLSLLERTAGHIRLTHAGIDMANYVMSEFLL